jgi:branched-chain amino acid transport system substrate-binding protein
VVVLCRARMATARLIALIAVMAVLAAACTPGTGDADQSRSVRVGILAALTGPNAQSGVDSVRGAQLAVDVVNEAHPELPLPLAATTGLPGLGGATLQLITADTAGASEQADSQIDSLVITEHVVATVVADSADVAAEVGRQSQRLRVSVLDACSTADFLTEQGMSWYFRLAPTDRSLAETALSLVESVASQSPAPDSGTSEIGGTAKATPPSTGANPPSLAVLAETGGQTAAISSVVDDLASRLGFPIVNRISVTPGTSDVDALAYLVRTSRPDAVVALAATSAAAAMMDRVGARLPDGLPMIGVGAGLADAARADDAAVARTEVWSADLASRTPAGRAVLGLYERTYGSRMTSAAAEAFTAVLTIAASINAAGSAEPAAIRASLRQAWVPAIETIMPWNGIRFSDNGQNDLAAGVVEARADSGFRVVYPWELATGPLSWSTPRW